MSNALIGTLRYKGTELYCENEDLIFISRITCIQLAAILVICWPLYISGEKVFASYPVVSILTSLPLTITQFLYFLNFLVLGWLFILPLSKAPLLCTLTLLCFWILQDINRFSACVFILGFTLTLLTLNKQYSEVSLNALRIMIIGVYFWAGFYKCTISFWLGTGPWFFAPLHIFSKHVPFTTGDYFFAVIIFATPFFESFIGILLLFNNYYRRFASCMAFTMLIVALACLGPTGHNVDPLAWPWNVQLFLLEFRLFINFTGKIRFITSEGINKQCIAAALLFLAMPALAAIYPWYEKMGFKLYTGNRMEAYILFSPDEPIMNLPAPIIHSTHSNILNVNEWVLEESHANYFSSESVILSGTKKLCPYLSYPQEISLRIAYPPALLDYRRKVETFALCK